MKNNIEKKGNWFIDQLNVYQSANSDYQSIKNNFIIRKNEFDIITSLLINKGLKDPLQHELILGRRGSGKSTLLKRIEIEIVENSKLNKKYIAINLAEEQAGIYRLFDLWEQVLEEIKYQFEIDFPLNEYSSFDTNDNYTNYLYQKINEICKQYKKRIVLLLDNFDRIVENFTDDGNLLRETLINYNDIQIIAGSTRMDEHFWRYDMPFYEFFRRHRLEALSKEEIYMLLNHWSDSLQIPELKDYISKHPGKIENIRILTDGLPRTLQFFIQMVLQNADTNSYDYLKKIMDNVTPLYQERLNNLPPQLRKTVLEMAFIWEACTTKQLVEKVKMESKLISANLKTLVEKGIVDKIETNKKNHLYRISERFFNMWLIITQGNPEQKRRAKWLSIFLENWYDENDIKSLVNNHIENLKTKKIDWDCALILSKSLSQSKFISTSQRDEIIDLMDDLKGNNNLSSLVELPKKSTEILGELVKLIDKNEYDKGIDLINSVENESDGVKFFFLGILYKFKQDYIKSKKYFLQSKEKGFDTSLGLFFIVIMFSDKFDEIERYCLVENGTDINQETIIVLSYLYYKGDKKKNEAYNLMNKYLKIQNDLRLDRYVILIEIWNGIFKDVENRANAVIVDSKGEDLEEFLFELLVQQQKHLVYKLFTNESFGKMLQDKYAVLYYATLFLNYSLDQTLKLRIPPEIESTIDDVLLKIAEREIFYGYRKSSL